MFQPRKKIRLLKLLGYKEQQSTPTRTLLAPSPPEQVASSTLSVSVPPTPSIDIKQAQHLSGIFEAIRNVLDLAEKVLDGIPIWGPKAAVAAIQEQVNNVKNSIAKGSNVDVAVEAVQKIAEALHPSLPTGLSITPKLHNRILGHIAELQKIRASTARWTAAERNLARRLLDVGQVSKELEELMKKIHMDNERFLMETAVRTEMKVEANQDSFDDAKIESIHDKDAREHALLHHLRPVKEAFHDAPNAPHSCLEGTREQLIADIFAWFNEAGPSCEHVFWLNGLAGTGKSVVARTVADLAQNQGRLAGTFFISRNIAATRASSAIIPTIAYQLALRQDPFRSPICAGITSDRDIRDRTVATQVKVLLQGLPDSIVSGRPLLIVLDALDECEFEGDDVTLLISKLASMESIKILVTSRPEPHMLRALGAVQTPTSLHDIEADIVLSDIHRYLTHSFEQLARQRRLPLPFPSPQALDELVRRTSGLFIYAATAVNYISDPIANPHLRLQHVLEQDEDEAPYQHRLLDRMYSEILSRAAETSGNLRKHERALRNILSAVVLLQEPVHASALVSLADEERREDILPSLSAVLLMGNENDAPIRLIHPSFLEFVTNEERCRDQRFLVKCPEGHLQLAVRCLQIMNMQLRQDICYIGDASLLNSEILHLDGLLARVAPSELRYACKYWHIHFRSANLQSPGLIQELETFCMDHLLHWIELLSLLDELPTALTSMETLLSHIRSMDIQPASIVGLLTDIGRLALAYQTPIRSSALHVYHSALVTMPQCRLWEQYGQRCGEIPSLLSPRPLHWDPSRFIIEHPAGLVNSVAFSPNGKFIMSGSSDCTIRSWDATIGTELLDLHGHQDAVNSVVFSPNGRVIASGSNDRTVRLWDATTGVERHVLHGHDDVINSVASSPDGTLIVSGSRDKTLRVWDSTTGTGLHCMSGHNDGVSSVAFSPDGRFIASGSRDCTVRVWDATTGMQQHIMNGHTRLVTSVAVSPDGSRIASCSRDSTVRVWDAITGTQQHVIAGHNNWVTSVAFSPDCVSIASCSFDHTIRVWNTMSGTQRYVMQGHDRSVNSVAFSPDGRTIVSGSSDHTMRVWDATADAYQHTIADHVSGILAVAFSPNGKNIVSGSGDGTVSVWNSTTGTQIHCMNGHKDAVNSVIFSPDGQSIVSGSSDHTVRVWDASTGVERHTMRGHEHSIISVAFSPGGQSIVSGSSDHTVRLWDACTGMERHTMHGHERPISSIAFSPDGYLIISRSDDGELIGAWNAVTGASLDSASLSTSSLPITPWSSMAVDRTGWIWRISPQGTRQRVCWLPLHCRGEGFAHHGPLVCIGARNGTVTILDLSHGSLL